MSPACLWRLIWFSGWQREAGQLAIIQPIFCLAMNNREVTQPLCGFRPFPTQTATPDQMLDSPFPNHGRSFWYLPPGLFKLQPWVALPWQPCLLIAVWAQPANTWLRETVPFGTWQATAFIKAWRRQWPQMISGCTPGGWITGGRTSWKMAALPCNSCLHLPTGAPQNTSLRSYPGVRLNWWTTGLCTLQCVSCSVVSDSLQLHGL